MLRIITSMEILSKYKKPTASSILFYLACPGENPAGLSQRMISVGSISFIPLK